MAEHALDRFRLKQIGTPAQRTAQAARPFGKCQDEVERPALPPIQIACRCKPRRGLSAPRLRCPAW